MKPTVQNFKKLCIVMYEFTGLEYYTRLSHEYSHNLQMGITWFELFYKVYNEVKANVKAGNVLKYYFVNIKGERQPSMYNSLNF